MKTLLLNPTKVLIVMVIVTIAAALAFAQQKQVKDKTITIRNGDTIVNGKNFKDLKKEEKAELLKELSQFGDKLETDVMIKRRGDSSDRNFDVIIRKKLRNTDAGDINEEVFKFNMDEFDREAFVFRHQLDTTNGRTSILRPKEFDAPYPNPHNKIRFRFKSPNNSQSFSYRNTDKDGISTEINISIGEASKEQLKKISGTESPQLLDLDDLMLFPAFSSGKMTLSFNLAPRGNTEVKVLGNNFNPVFADRLSNFSGNYTKQLDLARNGLYYIAVQQNGKWFVRRVIKE
jgi:hypothetical protein